MPSLPPPDLPATPARPYFRDDWELHEEKIDQLTKEVKINKNKAKLDNSFEQAQTITDLQNHLSTMDAKVQERNMKIELQEEKIDQLTKEVKSQKHKLKQLKKT